MTQSRIDSALEVAVNIVIGFAVSLAFQPFILAAFGIYTTAAQHIGITAAFTVVSVVRQYVIRRLCNGRSPYQFLRDKLA